MTPQAIIMTIAPRFEARPLVLEVDASTSVAQFAAFVATRGVMTVWDGASDRTIWRDARVNHAFRAWHDDCHLRVAAPFTLAGERRACEEQIRQLLAAYPGAHAIARTIYVEVIGQAEHYATFGTFPEDQVAFHNTYEARQ